MANNKTPRIDSNALCAIISFINPNKSISQFKHIVPKAAGGINIHCKYYILTNYQRFSNNSYMNKNIIEVPNPPNNYELSIFGPVFHVMPDDRYILEVCQNHIVYESLVDCRSIHRIATKQIG